MKRRSGLTLAFVLALLAGGIAAAPAAYADSGRGRWGGPDAHRHDTYRYSHHHSHNYDNWDRGYHHGHHGHRQDVVYVTPYREVQYRTVYYSPGYPHAVETYYRVGEFLPRYVRCEDPPRSVVAVLPPVSRGTRYVQVDQDVYLVAEASKQILDAVVLLSGVR